MAKAVKKPVRRRGACRVPSQAEHLAQAHRDVEFWRAKFHALEHDRTESELRAANALIAIVRGGEDRRGAQAVYDALTNFALNDDIPF